jgi:GNAT superfamily N-acetyltransferase
VVRVKIDKTALEAATKQFYLDFNVENKIFDNGKVVISNSNKIHGARIMEGKDLFFKTAVFLGKAFIMVDDQISDWAIEKFQNAAPQWFFEYGNLRLIDRKLNEYDREIEDTHIYFLPTKDFGEIKLIHEVKWFEQEELHQFKEDRRFTSALCFSNTQPDMLAVAAMDKGELIGMAGASMDGDYLWQIGINVLPDYQNKGLAANLTALLKQEVIRRGKIPFYGTSESHTISQNVGLKAGFLPAWSEIFVRNTLDKF